MRATAESKVGSSTERVGGDDDGGAELWDAGGAGGRCEIAALSIATKRS